MNQSSSLPLVSIVLATYNGETYLREQLDSLCNQSYPNIEIIAVDDKSSDTTVQILHDYSSRYENIKVYENEANIGFIKNFEKACSLSSGEFIAPCDQDDYWLPDKIKNKVEAIGSRAMIYCDSKVCDSELKPTGTQISDIVNCRDWTNCLEQAVFCRVYGHASLFRRSLFNNTFPFLTIIPHDWWLCYNATLFGGLAYLPQPLILYRQHDNNLYGIVDRKKIMKTNISAPLVVRNEKKELTKKERKLKDDIAKRQRMDIFYAKCPNHFIKEKEVLKRLQESYQSFSFSNNVKRMILFFQYRKLFLAAKKRSLIRQYFFCLKMFKSIR